MLKLEKVQKYVKRSLKKKFKKVKFDYVLKEASFQIITDLYFEKLGVGARVGFVIGMQGNTNFIVMFDRSVEVTPDALRLVNRFNDGNKGGFCALIKEETGDLELTHFFQCDIEAAYKSYVSDILIRLGSIVGEPNMQKLAALMQE